jgi:hypothetical protein
MHCQKKTGVVMAVNIDYLEGRRVCVVFCQLQNEDKFKNGPAPEAGDFKIKYFHGVGGIVDGKYLGVTGPAGSFQVPPSAYNNIFANDGTPELKDCEYFVMVKIDSKMEF